MSDKSLGIPAYLIPIIYSSFNESIITAHVALLPTQWGKHVAALPIMEPASPALRAGKRQIKPPK
jgi:hypothetical protein